MTIHILNDPGHYVVVRCHADDCNDVLSALIAKVFTPGRVRGVEDIPQMRDINVKRDGSWSQINGEELRTLFKDKGRMALSNASLAMRATWRGRTQSPQSLIAGRSSAS